MILFTDSVVLKERACRVLPGGVTSGIRSTADPLLFFQRAEGPYFYDVDGHQFLDYTLAWGPLILGSNHPRVNQAVTEQLNCSYALGAQHLAEVELAETLVRILPGVEQVLLSNTGTEAVQVALRVARAYTGRAGTK